MTRAAYVERIRHLCPDLAINQVEEIGDGFVSAVFLINGAQVFHFLKDPEYAWVAEAWPEQVRLLELVRRYVQIPVPSLKLLAADCLTHPWVPGSGLSRSDLLRLPAADCDRLITSLALLLRDLRSIPHGVLQAYGVGNAWVTRNVDEYEADLALLERQVFPYANVLVRRRVREHFEPVLRGQLDMNYEPALIHGDLKPWHILVTLDSPKLTGIIDWDDAGIDDPAQDVGAILYSYGETFVRQMAAATPEIVPMIDRARFYAGRIELMWVAAAIAEQDPRWLGASLGLARDISPIGTPFP